MNQPNRQEIKAKAREMIKGNLWNIWKPLLIIGVIIGVIQLIVSNVFTTSVSCSEIYGGLAKYLNFETGLMCKQTTFLGNIISFALPFIEAILMVGYTYYLLKLVRKEGFNLKDIFKYFKENLWLCVLTILLVRIFTTLWYFLFVIPGIIAAISYSLWTYIIADNNGEMKAREVIKQSKKMMSGHKWNFVVFELSFILWDLLVGITFGIAAIYVIPYQAVAGALYYEEIKKLNEQA